MPPKSALLAEYLTNEVVFVAVHTWEVCDVDCPDTGDVNWDQLINVVSATALHGQITILLLYYSYDL